MKKKNNSLNSVNKCLDLKKMSNKTTIGWDQTWLSQDIEEEISNSILPCGM